MKKQAEKESAARKAVVKEKKIECSKGGKRLRDNGEICPRCAGTSTTTHTTTTTTTTTTEGQASTSSTRTKWVKGEDGQESNVHPKDCSTSREEEHSAAEEAAAATAASPAAPASPGQWEEGSDDSPRWWRQCSQEAPPVQAGNHGTAPDLPLPEVNRASHQEASVSEASTSTTQYRSTAVC